MVNLITTVASVIGGIACICGAVYTICRWLIRQNQQDKDIETMKREQCLLTYGVLACLKGLQEQGCNGPVTEAIKKIDKHINQEAHDQI